MAEVQREDLPAMRELLRCYAQWRKARGLPPSDYWATRIKDGLPPNLKKQDDHAE